MTNKELCDTYPFLIPTDVKDWNYEYTLLDEMPRGWRIVFGEQMCQDIKDVLLDEGGQLLLNSYHVLEIKEKFGYLHWYGSFYTKRLNYIINKYERLSEHICINCGKTATKISKGWISPWCDDCGPSDPSQYTIIKG